MQTASKANRNVIPDSNRQYLILAMEKSSPSGTDQQRRSNLKPFRKQLGNLKGLEKRVRYLEECIAPPPKPAESWH